METKKLITLIDIALKEAGNYTSLYGGNKTGIEGTTKALSLLKLEVTHHPDKINERVLRAMHDTGMASFKEYENTPLEDAINAVIEVLYDSIPEYKNLEPLRNEFDKGEPI